MTHWEGSQSKLAFIKKELKQTKRTKDDVNEQTMMNRFPAVKQNRRAQIAANLEVAIKTKKENQAKKDVVYGRSSNMNDSRYIGGL